MKAEIIKNIKKLDIEFYKIQCKNWIPSVGTGYSGAGKTLENLLGKADDNLILPDYLGIELKTKQDGSEPFIGLFSMALDNKPLQTKRLLNIAGWPSKNNPKCKVFYATINEKDRTYIGEKHSFQLKTDYTAKVVKLCIYDHFHMEMINDLSWSFEQLKCRLEKKLSYLALINVKRWFSKEQNQVYYKYYKITYYKLISFERFLNLIVNGTIRVNIKISYYKSGSRIGEIHDKGSTFEISEEDLEKLFQKIEL